METCFLREKKRYRPFLKGAKISNKSCSQKLCRAICDLGADCSFDQASKKLQEHYNIELCIETVRSVTERYARKAQAFNQNKKECKKIAKQLIAEGDGSMVPIVEILKGEGDCRKKRNLFWKEFRLSALQKVGETSWLYAASYGSVDAVGDGLEIIAQRAGFCEKTEVHALGDGAIWVREQMERVFGCQMRFTIDFFHLCDYLSAAADIFSEKKVEWMKKAKTSLKQGKVEEVLTELKKQQVQYSSHKGLIDCIRYIENRESQFAYDEVIAKNLPIGSGKIESSHRNIIQQRMKKPGAWWKVDMAEAMIHLRVLRANGDWKEFWEEETCKSKAA